MTGCVTQNRYHIKNEPTCRGFCIKPRQAVNYAFIIKSDYHRHNDVKSEKATAHCMKSTFISANFAAPVRKWAVIQNTVHRSE